MPTKTVPKRTTTTKTQRPSAEFMDVTPGLAAEWLNANKHNRPVKAGALERYARDMLAGNWKVTGEAIQFNGTNTLLDGQHRLMAIVETGVTVPLLVVHGLPKNAQDVVDQGARRSAGDMLHLHGYTYTAATAAASNLALGWDAGEIQYAEQRGYKQHTHSEILEFVTTDPLIRDAVELAIVNKELAATPAAIGFAAWLFLRIDRDAAVSYLDDLSNMRTGGAGDPLFAVLRRLQTIKDTGERARAITFAYILVRGWNAWRQGEELSRIQTSTRGAPLRFPDPV